MKSLLRVLLAVLVIAVGVAASKARRNLIAGGAYDDPLGHYTSDSILTQGESYELENKSGYTISALILNDRAPVQNLGAVLHSNSLTFTSQGNAITIVNFAHSGKPVTGVKLRRSK